MNIKGLGYCTLVVICIVSGGFFSINADSTFYSGTNDVQTTSSLNQNLIFIFDETYHEETFHLTFSSLELSEFNRLTLFFMVNDTSTQEGLNAVFTIGNTSVEFTIERIFQDGLSHNLTETFLFPLQFSGDLDISIFCGGQSDSSSVGSLTIFNTTKIEKIEVPTLLKTPGDLPAFPNWLTFWGNQMGGEKRSTSSAFYYSKGTDKLNLTLSFFANEIRAFVKEVELSINDVWVASRCFQANSCNEMNFIFQPDAGFNLLSINFSVQYSSDLIQISTISLSGSLLHFDIGSDVFDSFQWGDGRFIHSFDLSSLKPTTYHSEQVLHVTVDYQCQGVKVSTGVQYSLKAGSTVLEEGTISYLDQMHETNSLEIRTYTTDYRENLYFVIRGSTHDVGIFLILNSSKIETAPLPEVTEEPLDRLVASDYDITSLTFFQTVTFYDVFQTKGSPLVNFYLSFNIDSGYEDPFDSMIVEVKSEGETIISKYVRSVSFTNISVQLPLQMGYHELRISFQITRLNTPIQIQDLRYQVEIIPEPPTISFPFGSQAVYWLLGFYGAFFFLFNDKNVFRKNIKRKALSHNLTESLSVEEQRKKETLLLVLELLTAVGSLLVMCAISYLLNILHWSLIIIYFFTAMNIGKCVYLLDLNKKPFRNTWKKVQEFFAEIDSFTDLFNKIVDFLTSQTKKYTLRFIILILTLLTAAVHVGILVFFNQRPFLMNPQPVSRIYSLLLASFIISSSFLFYALHLTKKFSFLEDNIRRVRLLGRLSLILVTGSLLVLNVLALSKTFDFTILWTFLSPLMIAGLTKSSNKLGQIIADEENLTYSKFLKNGKVWTKKKEVKQATEQGILLRKEWRKEEKILNKNRLRGIIIWDIKPEIPVSLTRLAELMKLSTKKTERLLDAILNEIPNLGEYHRKEQVFIRKLPDKTSGTEKMDVDKVERVPEIEGAKKVFEWEGRIVKGNSRGAGYLTLPIELRDSVEAGCFYDLSLIDSNLETHVLTAKLSATKKGWGFYIPQALCIEHSLVGETVTCYIYQMDHFPVKLSADKIIRLPNSIVEEYEIHEHGLFEVEVITDQGIFGEVVLITKTDRSNRSDCDEYSLTLRLSDAPRSTDARIKLVKRVEKLPSNLKEKENYENFYLPTLFQDGIMGKIHENEMIIFLGNHVPTFAPIRINLLEFIHYFGCYYADGTKKGWAWRINASTPEQAVYYVEKYNHLIYGNKLVYELTYSKKPSDKRKQTQIKKDLVKYWKEEANVEIEEKRIKLRETKHDKVLKWNKCGSLGIRDNRNLIMEIHLRVMDTITNYLKNKCINDKDLWDFLFGILEGDGFVSGGNSSFGVGFATNLNDKIIERLLTRLGIQHRIDKSRVKDGVYAGITLHFGLFEVLLNLKIINESLFIYYPKRRKTFIERLLKQPTVRFIMGKQVHLAPVSENFFKTTEFSLEDLEQILDSLALELSKMTNKTII